MEAAESRHLSSAKRISVHMLMPIGLRRVWFCVIMDNPPNPRAAERRIPLVVTGKLLCQMACAPPDTSSAACMSGCTVENG